MYNLRKSYRLAITFVLSVALLGPFFIGKRFAQLYPEYLQRISQHQNIKIELANYKKGYFTSKAILRLLIPSKDPNGEYQVIQLAQKIYHGPILLTRLGHHLDINFNPVVIHTSIDGPLGQQLRENWHNQDPAIMTTLVNWKSKIITKIKTNPIQHQFSNQYIDLSKASLQISHTTWLDDFRGELIIPKLSLHDSQNLSLEGVHLEWKGDFHSFFDLNDAQFSVNDLQLKDQGIEVLNLQGVELNLEKRQSLHQKIQYAIQGKMSHGKIYGDDYPFARGNINLTNVSPSFIHELNTIPANASLDIVTPKLMEILSQSGTKLTVDIPKKITAGLTTFFSYRSFARHQERDGHTLDLKPMFQQQTSAFLSHLVQTNTLQETVHAYQLNLAFKPEQKIELNGRLIENPLNH